MFGFPFKKKNSTLSGTLKDLKKIFTRIKELRGNISYSGDAGAGGALVMVFVGISSLTFSALPFGALAGAGVGLVTGMFTGLGGVAGLAVGGFLGGGVVLGGGLALGGLALTLMAAGAFKEIIVNDYSPEKSRKALSSLSKKYQQRYNAALDEHGESLSVRHQGKTTAHMKLETSELSNDGVIGHGLGADSRLEWDRSKLKLYAALFQPISSVSPVDLCTVHYSAGPQDEYDVLLLGDSKESVDAFNKVKKAVEAQNPQGGEGLVKAFQAAVGSAIFSIRRYKNGLLNDGINGEAAIQIFGSAEKLLPHVPCDRYAEVEHWKNGRLCNGTKGEPACVSYNQNGELSALSAVRSDGMLINAGKDVIAQVQSNYPKLTRSSAGRLNI